MGIFREEMDLDWTVVVAGRVGVGWRTITAKKI